MWGSLSDRGVRQLATFYLQFKRGGPREIEAGRNVSTQLAFPFYLAQDPSLQNGTTHIQAKSPLLDQLFCKHPQGHTQSFGFMVIFSTVKLTVKITHHL